ncbi:ABC transporter substrate-binding protein [Anaeromyxobacter oryzisoli]|uniref:ABC transporter substrate-binding protein n=1 Tax=Anaeromyxobacter oryzisoli TaxID=2925408 RepID=UPI0024130AF1|nr:ABC transporter substrate-binding protein [Anaeromyxobacter sp. SG63]
MGFARRVHVSDRREGFGTGERQQGAPRRAELTRRALLRAAVGAGIALPLAGLGARARGADGAGRRGRHLRLAWNSGAVCHSPIALAVHDGIFARHGLDVEVVNFAGSTEQLLEAIATGKADAGIGMVLRWLKPLEQGFDVKLVAGTHGGCIRLIASKASGIRTVTDLAGKTVAVSDLASPAKNFFSILLAKSGIDPVKSVDWRTYPPDLQALAIEKGEAQALAHWDPDAYRNLKSGKLVEVASNLYGEYRSRVCCVIGARGSLLREDRGAVRSLVEALHEAHAIAVTDPVRAAKVYSQQYSPKDPVEDLVAQLRSHTHAHHPVGADLRRELALYADDLKRISVLKSSTDPARFADKIFADVLS